MNYFGATYQINTTLTRFLFLLTLINVICLLLLTDTAPINRLILDDLTQKTHEIVRIITEIINLLKISEN